MKSEDRLIYLIFKTENKLRTYLRSQLAGEGVRITDVQSGILFLLKEKNGRTMTELSQILATDNSAITGLVDRLEKAGFIARKSAPNDRRAYLIHITPEGLDEIDKAKRVIRRVNEEVKAGFSDGEMEIFKKVMSGLFDRFSRN